MTARRRRGAAGPVDWLLAFLHRRDRWHGQGRDLGGARWPEPPQARATGAVGPADWLLAFLAAAATATAVVDAATACAGAPLAGFEGDTT